MKWARIKDGVVQEVRGDIGTAGAEYFHPLHYDAVLDVTENPGVEAGMLYQNGVFLPAEDDAQGALPGAEPVPDAQGTGDQT